MVSIDPVVAMFTEPLTLLLQELDAINSAAFANNETKMYALIRDFNEKYREIHSGHGFCAVRDDNSQCYTIGLTHLVG